MGIFGAKGDFGRSRGVKKLEGGGGACGNREVLLTWMGTVPGIHGLVKLVLIL